MRCLVAISLMTVAASAAAPPVKVRLATPQGNVTRELPLEKYVAAVVAGESSVFRSEEALKAMAVGVRTFAIRMRGRHAAEGYDFCATTHCQRLDLDAVSPRLESAVAATEGELLWSEGKPALAYYTRDCGGRTEDAGALWPDSDAAYLRGREDSYCARAGMRSWQWSADPPQVLNALRRSGLQTPRTLERIDIAQRTASGRARVLVLRGGGETVRVSAGSFRFALGRQLGWNTVLSDRYEVRCSGGRLVFQGSGAGHGVGLCQRGADEMGLAGRSYREILGYYFPATAVGLTARGISWYRLGGDSISLMTARPGEDFGLLSLARRALRDAAQRTALPPPAGIELRFYPDLDSFRNATGEPGWVAARTSGRRIDLQPAPVLRSRGTLQQTLRHELLHVLLETQAIAGLPVWFREGLAGYVEHPLRGGPAIAPSDRDLRQTADAARARMAYSDATRAVTALVSRYGEVTVFGWLKTGLPLEVSSSNTRHAVTNSK